MRFLGNNVIKHHTTLLPCRIFLKNLFSNSEDKMSNISINKKLKYNGKSKKRQWEDRRTDKGVGLGPKVPKIEENNKEDINKTDDKTEKIKRRKFAVLMGYSGVGYWGMQRNRGTQTIEEDLFKALFDAEFINKECYDVVQNMQFQRAARTDKGVSAARQVVSMKLGENFDISKVNEKLPEKIRLFAAKRVTKGFNSKSQCDFRTYIYVLPTIAFADTEKPQKAFRIKEETLKEINEILQLYVGTKNFHNFTVKKKPNDPSAKRFIKSFECEPPFVKDNVEFCALKVYGQSFMMHQIRKMVGLVLAVVRGMTTQNTIIKAFTYETVNVPRAPGLGLFLDYVHYERYNYRYGEDGMHEKLIWEEVENDVKEFKEKHILPTILNTEINEEAMMWWIQNKLARHSYDKTDEKDESDDETAGDDDGEEQDNSHNESAQAAPDTNEHIENKL
ncbi:pseudouridylate synthase 1 homolog [Euwallacea fornicatus]|uniref:pseudouridylate synthase 1 homolog n=1 Tax=Euwallacea fornicatus TaxID=995702 RepID=UPI00338FAF53